MSNLKKVIGGLSFSLDGGVVGRYGKVFTGRYEDAVDVSVLRIDKSELAVDKTILWKADLHPNIVRFYGAENDDENDEFQYIASELCACTLKQLIRDNRDPSIPYDNNKILWQISSGLEYLHAKLICHRDLNPQSVLFSRSDGSLQPRIKLSNFAFMRVSKSALPLYKIVKSKGWLPPDIYDQTIFTPQMDIFALGLLFAYVLSGGLHAFGSDKEERVFSIKKRKPMSLTVDQLKDVLRAAEVFDLIRSMVTYNPDERPTANAVLNHTFFGQSTDNEPVASFPLKPNDQNFEIQDETSYDDVISTHQTAADPSVPLQDANNSSSVPKRSLDQVTSISQTIFSEPNAEVVPKKSRQDESVLQVPSTPTEPLTVSINSNIISKSPPPNSSYSPTSTSLMESPTSPLILGLSQSSVDPPNQLTSPRLSNLLLSHANRSEQTVSSMQVNGQAVERESGSSSQLPASMHRLSQISATQPRETKGKKIERRQSTSVTSTTSDTMLHSPPALPPPQIIRPTIPCTAVLLPRSADEAQSPPSSPLSPFPIELGASFIPTNMSSTSPVFTSPIYHTSQPSTPSTEGGSRSPTPLFSPHEELHFVFPPNNQQGASTSQSREVVNQIPLPSSNQIPVACHPVGRRDSRVPSSDIESDGHEAHTLSPHDKEQKLLALCRKKDLDETNLNRLHRLLKDSNVNVNFRMSPVTNTPILLLCRRNASDSLLPALKMLTDRQDIDLNSKNIEQYSALMHLCRYCFHKSLFDCVKLLIDRGIRVEDRENGGRNSLFFLCQYHTGEDLVPIAQILINKSGDLDDAAKCSKILWKRKLQKESKSLDSIIRSIRIHKSREILRASPSTSFKSPSQPEVSKAVEVSPGTSQDSPMTPKTPAESKDTTPKSNNLTGKERELLKLCALPELNDAHEKRFRQLVSDPELNLNSVEALLQLCQNNKSAKLDQLIAVLESCGRVNFQIKDRDGSSAILIVSACYRGEGLLKIVKMLIRLGSDVNASSKIHGKNCLFALCRQNTQGVKLPLLDLVTSLIEAKMDVKVENTKGNVLVPLVLNHHHNPEVAQVIRLLINRGGMDINGRYGEYKNALLHLASHYKGEDFIAIVRVLVECGIDTDARDKNGKNAVDILKWRQLSQLSQVIRYLSNL